jgi:methionyl-tRNA formyltransferase
MTYAAKITAEDQRIDWTRPAADVDCQIRGLVAGARRLVRGRSRAGAGAPEASVQ